MFNILTINGTDYKARLTTRACVEAEKRLHTNPLNIFMEVQDNKLPQLGDILVLLHCSLQECHHGLTMDLLYDLYDDYIAEGNSFVDLVKFIVEVFKESGFIPKEIDEKNLEQGVEA